MFALLRATATALLMLLALTGAAVSGPFEDADAAYRGGDYATALRLLRPLADQGNVTAQFDLGVMYAKGQGIPQDYTEAFKWLRQAAEQDYAGAQSSIGVMYADGLGVAQDYVQAHMWLNIAASRYRDSMKEARDKAIKDRDLVASKMTPAQIATAEKLARERTAAPWNRAGICTASRRAHCFRPAETATADQAPRVGQTTVALLRRCRLCRRGNGHRD